jgi:hypothetical protein
MFPPLVFSLYRNEFTDHPDIRGDRVLYYVQRGIKKIVAETDATSFAFRKP